ncbi:hypothetical protein QTP88_019610 [Uroleucon formosanum]
MYNSEQETEQKPKNKVHNSGGSECFSVLEGKDTWQFLPGHECIRRGSKILNHCKPIDRRSNGSVVVQGGILADVINNKKRDCFYPTNILSLWTSCYDETNSITWSHVPMYNNH